MNKKTLTAVLITFSIILAFFVGFFARSTDSIVETKFLSRETKVFVPESERISVKSISIPAVSEGGNGITGEITAIISNGTGMINIDVSNLLVKEDTESSLRKAALYAFQHTEKKRENYNVNYHIETNAPAIEGSSAGASAAILTIAALENKTMKSNVMMTGTVHHDGGIGPADGIFPKAKAAEKANKTLFLVPETQSTKKNVTSKKYCAEYGGTELCSNEYTSKIIDVEEKTGIKVEEVENIEQALDYFF